MNANSLSGKTAVVTGTASGIGRAVAIMLTNNGAKVFGGDIAPSTDDETTFTDLNITTTNCDVTAEQDVI
ncbi:MAG: SDR family NAD(P)-dependent oxidoreductase, partial [Pirellulaceae bacterium]